MLHLHCQSPFFEQIVSGKKTIEGRLAKSKYVALKPGDKICFNDSFIVTVTGVRTYSTLKQMIESEGVERVLPGLENDPAPERIYRGFFSEEQEQLHGAVAIEIN